MTLPGSKNIAGFMAHYDLTGWWLTTFTEAERKFIDSRYQPSGLPAHTLTQGKWSSSKPASQFLNEVSTWFRSRREVSIAERIHRKVADLGLSEAIVKLGYHDGRHFTTYVTDVKSLKKAGKLEDAERLLLKLVRATEEENRVENLGVAPWYYEELAKIYRKQRNYAEEIAILERYARHRHAPGAKPARLMERLTKVKRLIGFEVGSGNS